MANLPQLVETLRPDWARPADTRGQLVLVVAGRFLPVTTIAYTNGGSPVVGSIDVTYDSGGQLVTKAGGAVPLNPNSGASADAITTPTKTVWQLTTHVPGTNAADLVRYLAIPDVAGPVDLVSCLTLMP